MTAIIVDDEKHCRDVLALLLQKFCPQVQVLASCADGQAGVDAITLHRPDMVFLDIEMPGMNGFDMLEACRYTNFKLIFTTAYNEYAIKAIRHNALDYILKPVDKDELVQAVQRAAQQRSSQPSNQIEGLIEYLNRQKAGDRIALPTLEGLQILQSEDIYYCESEGGYTRFFLNNGKVSLISKTLKEVEEVLESKGFCRIHNSYLINLRYVQKYIRGDGGEVIMANGSNIPVSRNKKQDFLNLLEKI
ncbi:response regulator transcription factor [Pseudoflavitalea sp. X16]|uniref:LytR/AlgR family response regulator transcription factor n=1 Tax=Paraflavitalea devenefica TaxID=2716334 RepID=UPI00142244D6|nr:LytTR family DNA-binding domain-containing protein [Paraflavitalea devenefica]NII27201.1 response regulator transcription factor [Paraflavitalea devenefica]